MNFILILRVSMHACEGGGRGRSRGGRRKVNIICLVMRRLDESRLRWREEASHTLHCAAAWGSRLCERFSVLSNFLKGAILPEQSEESSKTCMR